MHRLIIDSHVHLHDYSCSEDRKEILSSIKAAVICTASKNDFLSAKKIAQEFENAYFAVGIHPEYAAEFDFPVQAEMVNLLRKEKCIALGEIGLDGYFPEREKQLSVFTAQMEIAEKYNKPVILHCRKMNEELFSVLKKFPLVKAVYHGFTSGPELAERAVRAGLMIGIGTGLLFPNAKRILNTVKEIPLEKILLESDAPFMSPNKTLRNTPLNILSVAERIAEIKQTETGEVLRQNIENFKNFFHTEV